MSSWLVLVLALTACRLQRTAQYPHVSALSKCQLRLGLKLTGYVILKEIDVATDTACGFAFNNQVNCLSYNSEIASDQTGRFRCQLSDSDRFAGFDNFTVDIDFKYAGIQVTNIVLLKNLRSGPILAVLIHSLLRGRAKIGPDAKSQVTLVLNAARFDRSADWLLEQCHRIRLAVGITGSLKPLFLAWLNCAAVELENLRE